MKITRWTIEIALITIVKPNTLIIFINSGSLKKSAIKGEKQNNII